MLAALAVSFIFTAVPPPDARLSVTFEGARSDAMRRYVWAHEPSREPFPVLTPGGGGGLAVELDLSAPSLRRLSLAVGVRGRLTAWPGSVATSAASLWDLGVRSRIGLVLGPIHPWVGIGSAFGLLTVRSESIERQVVTQVLDFAAGLRLRLPGPFSVGLFIEAQHGSALPRPPEEFSTWRLGADLTLTFGLPARPSPAP